MSELEDDEIEMTSINEKPAGGSFADHPTSIAEHRASNGDGAKAWSPRDALISVLRDIDSGKIKPDRIAIVYTEFDPEDGGFTPSYVQAVRDTVEAIGLHALAIGDLNLRRGLS